MKEYRKKERRALTETEARMARRLVEKDLDLKRELARHERHLNELQAICSHAKRTDPRKPCPDCGEQSMVSVLDTLVETAQLPLTTAANERVAIFHLSSGPPSKA
ncbi:MAG: hypothetical protein AAB891_02155 [Patescibacteria group bacterium]